MLVLVAGNAVAETDDWESALAEMRERAVRMVEGAKILGNKQDLGSTEKTIKDGHRMMMEAEKVTARIRRRP
jgi:hypothetical protein